MKIEVGIKFEVVETVELEYADYLEGEVYEITGEEEISDGINFKTRKVEGSKDWLNLVEVIEQAFEEGKFKIVEEGSEMVLEVGSKLVLKEGGDLGLVYGGSQRRQLTSELEGVGYLEVKRLYPEGRCGVFLKGSWFEVDTYHLGVEELKQFKLLEGGKEMEQQNDFGLVAGDKVNCIGEDVGYYGKDCLYTIGTDNSGDFGVLDRDGDVMFSGRISSEVGRGCGFSFDNFEKVTVEEQVEQVEQLTPESKVTIEGKRYKLVRDLPTTSEVEVGDYLLILKDGEDVEYGEEDVTLKSGDIIKVHDLDKGCEYAEVRGLKIRGSESSYLEGYLVNSFLKDNFEIVEVEVTVKEK